MRTMGGLFGFWLFVLLVLHGVQSEHVFDKDRYFFDWVRGGKKPDKWRPTNPPGETRINHVNWGPAKELGDNDPYTTHVPGKGTFPRMFGILDDLYNITSIQVMVFLQKKGYPSGLNQKFDIYTRDKHINLCGPIPLDEWNVCKKDAILKTTGKAELFKCDPGATRARFIMVGVGSPNGTELVMGQPITELGIWGDRLSDDSEPDWGQPDRHVQLRKAIGENVHELWYEASWAQFERNDDLEDVALGWGYDKMMGLAVNRGKGRAVAMLGERWMNELNQPQMAKLSRNLKNWLGKGDNSEFRNANEPYKAGDVILVKRSLQFDADKIAKSVMDGENGVVISFLGKQGGLGQDNTVELLQKLNITVKANNHRINGDNKINPNSIIHSGTFVPQVNILQWAVNNFGTLCTRGPFFSAWTLLNRDMPLIKSPEYQNALRKMLEKYRRYFDDRAPCEAHPYRWKQRTRDCWKNYNLFAMTQMTENPIPLYGTHLFPGKTKPTEKKTTYTFTSRPPKIGWYFPTGAYVNPGEVFSWKVSEHSDSLDKYFFTFSCQRDNLINNNPWKRWPMIQHGLQLHKEGSYASPVGGILTMRMDAANMKITMQLKDVYRHSVFDIRNKSSIDDWDNERLRFRGVPWTIFVGDVSSACLQTEAIVRANKSDMIFSVNYLDNLVKIMHNFRGSQWENAGFEVFAVDTQLSAGDGHSGIPAYGHLPWQWGVTNVHEIKTLTTYGITHEFGHNLQNGAVTLKWGGEVTNNVYHFPVRGRLVNLTAYAFKTQFAFSSGDMKGTLDTWKGKEYNGVNLGYYNWLGIIFGEGLLVNMWHEGWNNRGSLHSEEQKVNFWLKKLCDETEYNLIPWQELWHFPMDNNTRTHCAKYRCFFPDDEVTQMDPDFVNNVISKVSGGCDRKPKKQVASKHDIMRGLYTQRKPWFAFV